MTIGSIFARALSTAINGQARVFDYGDRDTFIRLWTRGIYGCPEAFAEGEELTAGKPIVIIWDGRVLNEETESASDEGAGSLEPHLTPMDWALAFSIGALAQEGEVPKAADVAIHIVDLTGRDHTAWSMRMRHQLLAEMPWVTLHAPLIPKGAYRSGYRPVLDGYDSLLERTGTGWKLHSETDTLKTCARQGHRKNLVGLSRQWASTLVQTHDHHDLNNLVGPWILCGRMPETIPSLFAFWTRLRWTGFLPKDLTETASANIDPEELDVLTIDDQLDVGWNDVVCRLFGAEYRKKKVEGCFDSIGSNGNIELYGNNSAYALLTGLRKEGAFEKRYFDSPLPRSAVVRPWLLVLDLLLFPGGSSAEREWLTGLLSIARGIPANTSKLAWPGFSKDELCNVQKWLSSGNVEDLAYNTALSLLPRLCALRWPSVPILLFSGTSRRALTDKLAAYRNIFLAPQKPNLLSGNSVEEIEAFLAGWRRELDSAKRLIAVQRKLLRLQLPENLHRRAPSRLPRATTSCPEAQRTRSRQGTRTPKNGLMIECIAT